MVELEIERKFKVTSTDFLEGLQWTRIAQAYPDPEAVRLVLNGDRVDLLTPHDFLLCSLPSTPTWEALLRQPRENLTFRVRASQLEGQEPQHFVTLKGLAQGISCPEAEALVSTTVARVLFNVSPGVLRKLRYKVPVVGGVFEVDVFQYELAGEVIAEIELPSEDAEFERPSWLGEEVSTDLAYKNVNMLKRVIEANKVV